MQSEEFRRCVLQTIRRWNMLPEGARVGVAVSGGGDSVALFRIFHALAGEHGWTLCVLHVNHKMRGPESDRDESFVQALAEEHELDCKIAALPLSGQGNREEEARRLRYQWFEQMKQAEALDRIAVGHTRSDQAETVLFRFLRGSGAAGLAGMRPVLPNGIIRPLLDVRRDDVRAFLRALGQDWREDGSNQDLALARNRIRLQLLPELTRDWNPGLEQMLDNTAQWAAAEEDYWSDVLTPLAREHLQLEPGPVVICRADDLRRLPVAVTRRLIRVAIQKVLGRLRSIDFAHVEAIRGMLEDWQGSGRLQVPGLDVMRSFDWLRFAKPGSYASARHLSAPVEVPGETQLFSGLALSLRVENADYRYADYRYNESVNLIDADRIPRQLVLRTWQPGDQYEPMGQTSPRKLKTLFQDSRIPLWERGSWPVLAPDRDSEAIVWTRRFGVATRFAPGAETRRFVVVSEHKSTSASPKLESEPEVGRL